MRLRNITAACLSMVFGIALVGGCDEEVAKERDVDVKSDGTVVERQETVTEKADGTVVQEKSVEVDRPENQEDQNKDQDDDKDGIKLEAEVEKN